MLKGNPNGKNSTYNQKAQEIIVKKHGIYALKACAIDQQIEIRKTGLDVLSYLCQQRQDANKAVEALGILEICFDFIKQYPSEIIDHDVLCNCLDLVSEFVHPESKSLEKLMKKNCLNQLSILLSMSLNQAQQEQKLSDPNQVKQEQQVILKLCRIIKKFCRANAKCQD